MVAGAVLNVVVHDPPDADIFGSVCRLSRNAAVSPITFADADGLNNA